MALAEPALRQFGLRKLQNLRFRGGSLLGTAVGTGISLGYGIAADIDFTWPWSRMEQPGQSRRPFLGGKIPSNAVSHQYKQTLRTFSKNRSRNRNHAKRCSCKLCCCPSSSRY